MTRSQAGACAQGVAAWCNSYCSLLPASANPWGPSGLRGHRRGSLGEAAILDQAARHQVRKAGLSSGQTVSHSRNSNARAQVCCTACTAGCSACKGVQVFYAACQALLYILCFRLDGLTRPEGAPAAMQALFAGPLSCILRHWCASPHVRACSAPASVHCWLCGGIEPGSIITTTVLGRRPARCRVIQHRLCMRCCRLAPLSTCLPTVALEFVAQAAARELLAGLQLPSSGPSVRAQRPLEMFFPFDPYLLRVSAAHLGLAATYLRWRPAAHRAAAVGEPGTACGLCAQTAMSAQSVCSGVQRVVQTCAAGGGARHRASDACPAADPASETDAEAEDAVLADDLAEVELQPPGSHPQPHSDGNDSSSGDASSDGGEASSSDSDADSSAEAPQLPSSDAKWRAAMAASSGAPGLARGPCCCALALQNCNVQPSRQRDSAGLADGSRMRTAQVRPRPGPSACGRSRSGTSWQAAGPQAAPRALGRHRRRTSSTPPRRAPPLRRRAAGSPCPGRRACCCRGRACSRWAACCEPGQLAVYTRAAKLGHMPLIWNRRACSPLCEAVQGLLRRRGLGSSAEALELGKGQSRRVLCALHALLAGRRQGTPTRTGAQPRQLRAGGQDRAAQRRPSSR